MAVSELLTVKLVTMFVLLVGSFIVATIPIVLFRWHWLRRWKHMSVTLKVLRVFEGLAGGILLGVAMLHLIPEANEQIHDSILKIIESKEHHNSTLSSLGHSNMFQTWSLKGSEEDVHGEHVPWYAHFSWSPLLACLALLLIQFMENVLMKFVEFYKPEDCSHHVHEKRVSKDDMDLEKCAANAATAADSGLDTVDAVISLEQHMQGHHNHSLMEDSDMYHGDCSVKDSDMYIDNDHTHHHAVQLSEIDDKRSINHELRKRISTEPNNGEVELNETDTSVSKVKESVVHSSEELMAQERRIVLTKFLNTMILWISTCLHAFFEGLGLGSQKTSEEMWSLFGAIVAHKVMESFALGVIIERGIRSRASDKLYWSHLIWMTIFLVTFTLATPSGIAIGIGISESNKGNANSPGWTIAINLLLSLACGAFIHISLFEILNSHSHDHGSDDDGAQEHNEDHHHGHHHHQHGKKEHPLWALSKFILFIIGFVGMGGLSILGH